jgi:hypothetical protein
MKGFEIKVLISIIFALLFLIVALGVSLEKIKNDLDIERHNETSSEDVPTVSDSLSIRRDSSLERLR